MLQAFHEQSGRLRRLSPEADLSAAQWLDLFQPLEAEAASVETLGVSVPTLADMEEIEISNRLYREGGIDYMTVVLPGLSLTKTPMSGPVTFILAPGRLVTVRHHAPRPFETFPDRADRSSLGCATAEKIFLGLTEEIIARLADLLEAAGQELDGAARGVLTGSEVGRPELLRQTLERVGWQGELLGRVRLGLLTMERALSFFGQSLDHRTEGEVLRTNVKAQMRDISALGVHADFLSSRVSLTVDATLGMISLEQNATVRIVSVVAALFLPPTLVASIYGMNFRIMPELDSPWGYPIALVLMVASALITFFWFRWKKWL